MNIPERIEATRKVLRLNQGEMGSELGLGRTMYHYVKSGERELGNKALRELERLEAVIERRPESEARIGRAAATANKYPDECSKQLAFELQLTREHLELTDAKLLEVEKELSGLKRKLRKLGEE